MNFDGVEQLMLIQMKNVWINFELLVVGELDVVSVAQVEVDYRVPYGILQDQSVILYVRQQTQYVGLQIQDEARQVFLLVLERIVVKENVEMIVNVYY